MVIEISFSQWKDFADRTKTDTIQNSQPWQNIFHSCQYSGLNFAQGPNRKYYAIQYEERPVAALAVYRLSSTVGRIRTPYCLPEFRRKGLTLNLMKSVLESYDPSLKSFVGFVTRPAIPFFEAVGYRLQRDLQPFYLKIYDPRTTSHQSAHDALYLMSYEKKETLWNL